MAKKYKIKEFEIGDVKVADGVKSTVTDIDSTTGAISWSIAQVPNIDRLLDESEDLVATAKGVYTKVKDDKKFLDIYQQAKSLRNVIRTHVRNNYPEEYKKSRGVNEAPAFQWRKANSPAGDTLKDLVPRKVGTSTVQEDDINEESSSVYKTIVDLILNAKSRYPVYYNTSRGWVNVGGTGYQGGDLVTIFKAKQGQSTNIKNVFYKAAQTPDETKKEVEKLSKGKISVDLEGKGSSAILKYNLREEEEVEEMSTSGAAGGYLTPYAFRKKGAKSDDEAYKELGYTVVKEKALPVVRKKLAKVPKAKKVASKYKMKMPSGVVSSLGYTMDEGALGDGADLGPGPKAGDEGVTDNAYVKQFKYKLVPKKNGTYVQKGSGMIVKKLF